MSDWNHKNVVPPQNFRWVSALDKANAALPKRCLLCEKPVTPVNGRIGVLEVKGTLARVHLVHAERANAKAN